MHTVIPRYEDEGMAWGMMAECKQPLVPAEPCYAVAEFLDPEFKEENVEIMVSMAVRLIFVVAALSAYICIRLSPLVVGCLICAYYTPIRL